MRALVAIIKMVWRVLSKAWQYFVYALLLFILVVSIYEAAPFILRIGWDIIRIGWGLLIQLIGWATNQAIGLLIGPLLLMAIICPPYFILEHPDSPLAIYLYERKFSIYIKIMIWVIWISIVVSLIGALI